MTREVLLHVLAAASLSAAFTQIGHDFERANPGTRVRLNLAGTPQLVSQIEQGAPADVFASADVRWMTYLEKNGRLDGEASVFAHNRLVVILPRANRARISRLEDLARPGLRIVIGAETVPVGRYAREALRRLAEREGFPADYAGRVMANVASEEENVKGVVGRVQIGEADAGLCYRSDVTASVASRVRVLEIPDESNVPASYPIAVLAGSDVPEPARAFIRYVLSEAGQRTLGRHGLSGATRAP